MAESFQTLVLEQLEGKPFHELGEGRVFVVKSESDPMGFYYVCKLPWITTCTCKGFRFRTDCKHVRMIDEDLPKGVDKPDLHAVE